MDETSHVLGGEFHSKGLVTSGMCSASLIFHNRKPTSKMEIKTDEPRKHKKTPPWNNRCLARCVPREERLRYLGYLKEAMESYETYLGELRYLGP